MNPNGMLLPWRIPSSHRRLNMAVRFDSSGYPFEFEVVELTPAGAALSRFCIPCASSGSEENGGTNRHHTHTCAESNRTHRHFLQKYEIGRAHV